MKSQISIGGRPRTNDPRRLHNWVGQMSLKATQDGDQFIFAAFYRALTGTASDGFRQALEAEAKLCLADHRAMEKQLGQTVRLA